MGRKLWRRRRLVRCVGIVGSNIRRLSRSRKILIPLRRRGLLRNALSLQDLGLPLIEHFLDLGYPFWDAVEVVFHSAVLEGDEVVLLIVR